MLQKIPDREIQRNWWAAIMEGTHWLVKAIRRCDSIPFLNETFYEKKKKNPLMKKQFCSISEDSWLHRGCWLLTCDMQKLYDPWPRQRKKKLTEPNMTHLRLRTLRKNWLELSMSNIWWVSLLRVVNKRTLKLMKKSHCQHRNWSE